jgi:hypothetical protein
LPGLERLDDRLHLNSYRWSKVAEAQESENPARPCRIFIANEAGARKSWWRARASELCHAD